MTVSLHCLHKRANYFDSIQNNRMRLTESKYCRMAEPLDEVACG